MTKTTSLYLLAGLLLLALVGCGPAPVEAPDEPIEGARVTGALLNEESAGTADQLTINVEAPNEPIGIDFRGTLVQGSLHLQLVNAAGETTWDLEISSTGPFVVNTVVKPERTGTYQLELTWPEAVQATYSLRWQPGTIEVPEIAPLALVPGIGMILVALGYVVYTAVRKLGWGYLGLGAASWVVSVVLKFAWALSANASVYETLTGALPETPTNVIYYIYVGLLTGVFEVALIWLFLRNTKYGEVPWQQALSFGIGFGALEALLVGVSGLANAVIAITSPEALPLAALEGLARTNNLFYGLAPVWERFFTVPIHVLSNVLLFYSIAREDRRAFWLAFAYKTGIDAVAAFAQFWGLDTVERIWIIEALVALWGIAGWWGTRRVKAVYPPDEAFSD
jgi:uncharacterized membrane protein YhfC